MHPSFRLLLLALAMPLAAFAQPKLANIGPVFIDYGPVRMGDRVTVPVTVRNLTAGTISFSGGGLSGAHFTTSGGTCSGSLAAGATCEFRYTFRPKTDSGLELAESTTLGVFDGTTAQLVELTFVGSGFESIVDMTPRSVDFGNTLIGETVTVPVTVTNPTTETVFFSGGGISPGAGFSANGGTCGSSLAAGATCQFNYFFTPNALGTVNANTSMGVSTGSPLFGQAMPLSFSGTGVDTVGLVSIRPVGVDFGPIRLGTRMTVPVLFTNLSAVTTNFAGGGFSDQNSDGGAFSGGLGGGVGCTGSTVAVGATCSVLYRLRARELRSYAGSTSLGFFQSGGASQSAPLSFSGRGVGTIGQVAAKEIDLGEVKIGTSQSTRITVKNTTDLDLVGFVGGNLLSPFTSSNNCPSTLAPGASCEFTFGFNATANSEGLRETQTALSFTNTDGVQPVHIIRISAFGYVKVFGDGFE